MDSSWAAQGRYVRGVRVIQLERLTRINGDEGSAELGMVADCMAMAEDGVTAVRLEPEKKQDQEELLYHKGKDNELEKMIYCILLMYMYL